MVSAMSRISSAISFGVFLRAADSTMAIIWSRKLWPASAVTRTTIQSDSTVVPPVTAERSPPASRMTGADSPVMALSSTEAAPMTISPSAGICSFAATKNRSFFLRMAEFTSSAWMRKNSAGSSACAPLATRPSLSLWAITSRLAARKASACALPRPSAMASAKFANSTVSHSTTETAMMNPGCASAMPNSDSTNRASVRMAEM